VLPLGDAPSTKSIPTAALSFPIEMDVNRDYLNCKIYVVHSNKSRVRTVAKVNTVIAAIDKASALISLFGCVPVVNFYSNKANILEPRG
jgi:hypothetical protein